LRQARQQRDGALDLASFNNVHVPFAFLAIALLPVVIAGGLARALSPQAGAFALAVLLALIANAAICGIFSNPVDRYQSRLAWLAPLTLAIAAFGPQVDLGRRPRLA
jgi:hypothetical protein